MINKRYSEEVSLESEGLGPQTQKLELLHYQTRQSIIPSHFVVLNKELSQERLETPDL